MLVVTSITAALAARISVTSLYSQYATNATAIIKCEVVDETYPSNSYSWSFKNV